MNTIFIIGSLTLSRCNRARVNPIFHGLHSFKPRLLCLKLDRGIELHVVLKHEFWVNVALLFSLVY
ncbi:hypothetical protein HanPSC8_Chr15g0651411 [Helianthus annuus]|nr:hypothetical protein HanPSC8_Chr15g0651411 [Helianthus annuus]